MPAKPTLPCPAASLVLFKHYTISEIHAATGYSEDYLLQVRQEHTGRGVTAKFMDMIPRLLGVDQDILFAQAME